MVRFAAAVVLGYLLMLVVVFAVFTAAYPMLSVDRLFEPGSYQAARGWIVLTLGISLVAAMAAGALCARLAPATAAPFGQTIVPASESARSRRKYAGSRRGSKTPP